MFLSREVVDENYARRLRRVDDLQKRDACTIQRIGGGSRGSSLREITDEVAAGTESCSVGEAGVSCSASTKTGDAALRCSQLH